jgi:hypothetical protein
VSRHDEYRLVKARGMMSDEYRLVKATRPLILEPRQDVVRACRDIEANTQATSPVSVLHYSPSSAALD